MANRNLVAPDEIRISTTAMLKGYLRELVMTGLYGKTEAEAAEILLSEAIRRLIDDGTLTLRTQPPSVGGE